ncbi:MAG: hypothetical protein ACHQT5_01085 [Candidatus Saccharimonadales bacterium]
MNNAESYSLEHVDAMIGFLDKQIAAGKDTPAMLNGLQQRLDIISMTYQQDPRFAAFYSRMLELQALIHGRRQEDDKALTFMKEAVRQAGGVGQLYSETIRQYIASHTNQAITAHGHGHRRKRLGKFGALLRFRSRNAKVAFAVVFGLLLVSVASLHFVPQASAFSTILTNHSQIAAAKSNYEAFTNQLNQCQAQLSQERNSVNTSDQVAIDQFNSATKQCQAVQQQQNQAANKYDSLIGAH